MGKITEVKLSDAFDIILANINKNVLLSEINIYARYLAADGLLLLSGFYTHDIPDLLNEAGRHKLTEVKRDERETWAALLLKKV
jgi:ribosomal protein L11 methyltransferase